MEKLVAYIKFICGSLGGIGFFLTALLIWHLGDLDLAVKFTIAGLLALIWAETPDFRYFLRRGN